MSLSRTRALCFCFAYLDRAWMGFEELIVIISIIVCFLRLLAVLWGCLGSSMTRQQLGDAVNTMLYLWRSI